MESDLVRFCYTFDLNRIASFTFKELITHITWEFNAQFDPIPSHSNLTRKYLRNFHLCPRSEDYCWLFRLLDQVLLKLADLRDIDLEDKDQGDGLLKCRRTKTRLSNLNQVKIRACEVITCSHPPHYPHRPWPWISLPQESVVDSPPISHPRPSSYLGSFESNLPSSEAISSNHGTYSVVEPNSARPIPILSPLGVRRRALGQDRLGRRNGAQTSNLIYLVGHPNVLQRSVLARREIGHFSTTEVRYPNFHPPPSWAPFQLSCHRKRIQPLTWLTNNDLPTPDQN